MGCNLASHYSRPNRKEKWTPESSLPRAMMLVVLWHQRGRSTAGESIDEEVLGLYRFRDGKLARAQMFYFDTVPVANFLAKAQAAQQ